MKTTVRHLLILLIILATHSVYSQEEKSFTIITDQDFFYLAPDNNEDRNYTQGTSFTLSDDRFYSNMLFAPFQVYSQLKAKIIKKKTTIPVMSSATLLGTAFTPRIIDSISPIVGDRPFAFLLSTSFNQLYRIGINTGHNSNYEALTINIGLLGTDIGYDFQSFAHVHIKTGRPKDPIGWNTQISKGGKFTLLVNYERIKFLSLIPSKEKGFGLDGSINIGASVGYYERAYAGTYVRCGWIHQKNMPVWAFWGNGLANASKNTLQNTSPTSIEITNRKRKFDGIELFAFGRFMNNFMFRNSLLVGQRYVHDDLYTLDKSWVKTYLFDVDFGIAFGLYWAKKPDEENQKKAIRIVYKNTIRSPEFDSQIFPTRYHFFGSWGIQYSW